MAAKLSLLPDGSVPRETVLAMLAEARHALHQLAIGRSVVSTQYSSTGGGMGTTFTQADRKWLAESYIPDLERQAGVATVRRRRAIGVRFG
jgi:hypothetical protein